MKNHSLQEVVPNFVTSDQGISQDSEASWRELWPAAKRGDLGARAVLFLSVGYDHIRLLPGSLPSDAVSKRADMLFLAIHSTGIDDTEWGYRDAVTMLYDMANVSNMTGGKEFLECFETSYSPSCSQIAVEHGLVPSFDSYAAVVDQLRMTE